MKSITIHKIDEPLGELIKSKANAEGLSINKTVKKLLEQSLGVKPRPDDSNRQDFEEFCGVWTHDDLASFEFAARDLAEMNPEDWK